MIIIPTLNNNDNVLLYLVSAKWPAMARGNQPNYICKRQGKVYQQEFHVINSCISSVLWPHDVRDWEERLKAVQYFSVEMAMGLNSPKWKQIKKHLRLSMCFCFNRFWIGWEYVKWLGIIAFVIPARLKRNEIIAVILRRCQVRMLCHFNVSLRTFFVFLFYYRFSCALRMENEFHFLISRISVETKMKINYRIRKKMYIRYQSQ